MATDRQIEANRRNAERSTGPKTDQGKARSRANATKHGMAAESAELEAQTSPEFAQRRAQWGAEYQPVGQAAQWAMDRAVAASFRIERCETALDKLTVASRERARLAWDMDREVEAATIFERLKRNPGLASRQLQTSLSGVGLLIEAWMGLLATLQGGGDWSEPEESMAMDLLGIAIPLRTGRTMIDAVVEAERLAHRKAIAIDELDRLEAIREQSMVPLEEMDRRMAMTGEIALLSKPAKLLLRYEREGWRRYREAIRQIQDQSGPAVVAASSPMPGSVASRPEVVDRASKSMAVQAEAMAIGSMFAGALDELEMEGEDAYLDELERRMEARFATERTQFESELAERGRPVVAGF